MLSSVVGWLTVQVIGRLVNDSEVRFEERTKQSRERSNGGVRVRRT
jgi:hypothetical protein